MLAVVIGAPAASARYNPQAVSPNWVMPAQGHGDHRGHSIRPLREVVDELRSRYGGELISARLEDGPRPTYVLRWRLPDGQVRDFRVPADR
jgi:hypothetical protein